MKPPPRDLPTADDDILTTAADRARGLHRSQLGWVRTIPDAERRALKDSRRAAAWDGDGWADALLERLEND